MPNRLKTTAAVWGGVGLAAVTVRALKRWRNTKREERLATAGGQLPDCPTVVHALAKRAERTPDVVALVACDGTKYTWARYEQQAEAFARALLEIGEGKGVAVHAFNEPRWFFAALGALKAGWTVSGIYTTNTYDQAAHILKTSGVRVLVLESRKQLETTYKAVFADFPALKVVLLDGTSGMSSWDAFVKHDGATLPITASLEAVASLVYTSGTTGNPKAVELTNEAIFEVCAMMHARIPLDDATRLVSYLPLSHIAAMGIDVYSAIYCGAQVHFADAQALKGSLKNTLLSCRPTLFFGVPRVWEKMAGAMQSKAAETYSAKGGSLKKAIGTAAKTVGGLWWHERTPEILRIALAVPFGLFKILAYKKVRKACGLDKCTLLYTGAAPLSDATQRYLRSLDMPLLEVFGMSESCGAIAVCGPLDGARPVGSCGRPLPHGDVEIGGDGEVLWRGGNVMKGYRGLRKATDEAVERGQLHTGDLGTVGADGYLRITGRKKDLIITAGGENIAPTPIENTLQSLIPRCGHVVLIGDGKKYLAALVAPADDARTPPSPDDISAALETYNKSHAQSRAQTVQKCRVLERPFSVESGELTPTMKVKRAAVVKTFAAEVDALYATNSLVSYSTENILDVAAAALAAP